MIDYSCCFIYALFIVKNTMVQVGVPTSGGPGQMAGNMQNPNMSAGQFGGGNGSEGKRKEKD